MSMKWVAGRAVRRAEGAEGSDYNYRTRYQI